MSFTHLMAELALCLTSHTLISAQSAVNGSVNDATGQPVEFANVTLLSANDSTLVDGAVTGADGNFTLTGSTTPCLLHISALGFEDRTITNPAGYVGKIILTPSSIQLAEIEVKGSRPVTRLKNDGLQVTVAGTYLSNTGTTKDLLGKLPFVTRTGSEIEVIGKGTPIIYINGRQVRDLSELEQLASSAIKSVDVVTSPGARYDASANAVIRITTLAPSGEGLSLNDRTTVGYKHYVYLFQQADINWRKDGFDLFGMLNYENYRERPRVDTRTTQYLQSGTINLHGLSRDFAKYPVNQGKIGMNYTSDSHSGGIYYDFSFRPSTTTSTSTTTRLIDGIIDDELSDLGTSSCHKRQHLISAYFTGKINGWQLSANFDAMFQRNDRFTSDCETSAFNSDRFFTTLNDVTNRLLACDITATRTIRNGELRFGLQMSDINRKDIYMADVEYITDNNTKIHETTSALFTEATQTFGKVSLSAGLRCEYTYSRYYVNGEMKGDQSRKYHKIAPSASISLPVGNISTSLSYTRKTSRPAFDQLSSAVKYIDRYSYESGNPYLKPIYRDYISLTGSWRDIVVELDYCSTKNYFIWQTIPYPGKPQITLLQMQNMPRYNSIEAIVNYSPVVFDIWRPTLMAGVMAQNFKLIHNGFEMKFNRPIGIFRINNAIHLPYDTWLNVDLSARTSGNGDNLYIHHRWNCDIGLYKSFTNDTWSLKLQLNDLFESDRMNATSYDAISRTNIHKINDTRDFTITLRYNFNSPRTRFRGHGAANAEKSRF